MARLGERHAPARCDKQRDLLIIQHRRLSYFAANLWSKRLGIDPDEARGECDLALIRAAALWRSDGGKTFAAYAVRAMFHRMVNLAKRERRHLNKRGTRDWDTLPDPRQLDPAVDAAEREEMRAELARLYRAMTRLDTRARLVMLARAAGEGPRSIAARMGVSRQRIQQIEQQARETLMEMLCAG